MMTLFSFPSRRGPTSGALIMTRFLGFDFFTPVPPQEPQPGRVTSLSCRGYAGIVGKKKENQKRHSHEEEAASEQSHLGGLLFHFGLLFSSKVLLDNIVAGKRLVEEGERRMRR